MAVNVISAREINDLLLGTFDDYGPPTFGGLSNAQELQRYEVMGYMLNEDKMTFDSGIGIKRTIMTKYDNVAHAVGFHEAEDTAIADHLAQLDVPWRHYRTKWAFETRETMMNKGKALITNVIKPREGGALLSLADTLEADVWKVPATTDEKHMYGIPYYVVHDTSTEGFVGDLPGSHTSVAGIDPAVHTKYQNWSAIYADFTPDDWLLEMRRAHLKTNFVSPVTSDDFRGEVGSRWRIYTNDTGMEGVWKFADERNQNLSWDFGKMDNNVTFRGNAIRYVPQLDDANRDSSVSNDPFFFLDRGGFFVAALEMDYMRRTEAMNSQSQPDSWVIYVNVSLQLVFPIRRTHGVIAKSA